MDSVVAAAQSPTTFAPTSTTGRVKNSCTAAQIAERMEAREALPTSGEQSGTRVFRVLWTSRRKFSRASGKATAHAPVARRFSGVVSRDEPHTSQDHPLDGARLPLSNTGRCARRHAFEGGCRRPLGAASCGRALRGDPVLRPTIRAKGLSVSGFASRASGSGGTRRTSLGALRGAGDRRRVASQRPARGGSVLTVWNTPALFEGEQQVVTRVCLRMDAGRQQQEVPKLVIPPGAQESERPPPGPKAQVGRVWPGRCRLNRQQRRLCD